jgi:L-ascorbate metabolism protein UlaG (beta-lactamase superfamily)
MSTGLIVPRLAGDAFLADVETAAAQRRDGARLDLWWVGQSGFLLGWRDRHLLLDPYLSDTLTGKYAATDKPHVRMSERVVDPARLGLVDVVTASHAHTDHLDPGTLRPLLAAAPGATLVVPESVRALAAERAGVEEARPVGLDDGAATRAAGIEITAVPAAHERIEHDEQGRMRHLGYVVRCGPFAVYHAGDTLPYDGMAARIRDAAAPRAIDLALLPINGRAPERRVAGNLDGEQAARLAREIGAGLAVPCHYDMFAFNTASPDGFAAACRRLGQPCAVLELGERRTLSVS